MSAKPLKIKKSLATTGNWNQKKAGSLDSGFGPNDKRAQKIYRGNQRKPNQKLQRPAGVTIHPVLFTGQGNLVG